MDDRTEREKIDAMATRSEIGERAGTVLVIAPSHREAQDWAAEHGIPLSRTLPVTPRNFDMALRGRHGTPHVIVRWHAFYEVSRKPVVDLLRSMQSPPWEDLDAGLREPAAVRDPGLG